MTPSPADVIRRVVEEIEEDHPQCFDNDSQGWCPTCEDVRVSVWPCDAARLAAGLRVAVEALEDIAEKGRIGPLDSSGVKRSVAFDALALIAEKVGGGK